MCHITPFISDSSHKFVLKLLPWVNSTPPAAHCYTIIPSDRLAWNWQLSSVFVPTHSLVCPQLPSFKAVCIFVLQAADNAKNNAGLRKSKLYVSECTADGAEVMKRWTFASKGK